MSPRARREAVSAEEFLSRESPFETAAAPDSAPDLSPAVPPAPELDDLAAGAPHDDVAARSAAPAADGDFLAFYGLRELPFPDSVDPRFFFRTAAHDEAIVRLSLAIRHDISLALVTGVSGTGKTIVSQMLLQQLDANLYRPVLVLVTPGMGRTALLGEILSELGLAGAGGAMPRTRELLKQLHDAVIDLYQQGKRLVILLDECHFLSADCLHMVRTISNLEIPERKLSTCLLFGESRFLARLNHPSFDSLRNRIYFRAELPGLGAADCAQYVKFRTLVAGRMDDVFDEAALSLVHEATSGICRRINKLCTLALVEGCRRGLPVVDRGAVEACVAGL